MLYSYQKYATDRKEMKKKQEEMVGTISGPASHQQCVFSSCSRLQTEERGVSVATAAASQRDLGS